MTLKYLLFHTQLCLRDKSQSHWCRILIAKKRNSIIEQTVMKDQPLYLQTDWRTVHESTSKFQFHDRGWPKVHAHCCREVTEVEAKGDSFKSSQIQKNLLRCVFVWAVLWPANVMRMSQFSVGTVFIQDLWDMMCLPACSSRFPNNLSEREREEGERGGEKFESPFQSCTKQWHF